MIILRVLHAPYTPSARFIILKELRRKCLKRVCQLFMIMQFGVRNLSLKY